MTNPDKMICLDGTKVTSPRQPLWNTEIISLFVTLKTDPTIELQLRPEFRGFNGAIFNIRAQGSNNVCYWISQTIGSILIGLLLDRKSISCRIRAYMMPPDTSHRYMIMFISEWALLVGGPVFAYQES